MLKAWLGWPLGSMRSPTPLEHVSPSGEGLGPEHPDVATSLNNLGGAELYRAQGQYAEAQPPLEHALALREKVLGRSIPTWPRASTTWRSSTMLRVSSRRGAALPAGAGPPGEGARPRASRRATSLNNLALLYRAQGQYAGRGSRATQRALAIWRRCSAQSIPTWRTSLNNLAQLYHAQGHMPTRKPRYQRALAIWEKALAQSIRRGHEPQQSGGALPCSRALQRGGAALPAGAGHPGEGARPGASRRGPKASTIWRCSTMLRAAMTTPSALPAGAGHRREGVRPGSFSTWPQWERTTLFYCERPTAIPKQHDLKRYGHPRRPKTYDR